MPAKYSPKTLDAILAQVAAADQARDNIEKAMLAYVEARDKVRGDNPGMSFEQLKKSPEVRERVTVLKEAQSSYFTRKHHLAYGHSGPLFKSLSPASKTQYVDDAKQREMMRTLARGGSVSLDGFKAAFNVDEVPPGVISDDGSRVVFAGPLLARSRDMDGYRTKFRQQIVGMPLNPGKGPEEYLNGLSEAAAETLYPVPATEEEKAEEAAPEAEPEEEEKEEEPEAGPEEEEEKEEEKEEEGPRRIDGPPTLEPEPVTDVQVLPDAEPKEPPVPTTEAEAAPQFVEEATSRAAPPGPGTAGITPKQALATLPAEMEEKSVERLSLAAMKARIRALHLVYDATVDGLRDKDHQTKKAAALKSKDKAAVRAHLLDMLRKIRQFHEQTVGQRVGVIIPAEALVKQLLAGIGAGTGAGSAVPVASARGATRLFETAETESSGFSDVSTISGVSEFEETTAEPEPAPAPAPAKVVPGSDDLPPRVPTEPTPGTAAPYVQPERPRPMEERPREGIVEGMSDMATTAGAGMGRRLEAMGRRVDHAGYKLARRGDQFGHAIASSVYYRTSGMEAYKRKPVAGHVVNTREAEPAQVVADPVQVPTGNHLQQLLRRKKKPLPDIKLS
jgi:hypothetical protein